MSELVLWVLARPNDAGLPFLGCLPKDVRRYDGARPEHFAQAPPPDVVFDCWIGREVLEALWPRLRCARLIHSRSAGLDGVLFEALASSDVTLTNGRGVFSAALAEFVIAALLYFAKDLGRMRRAQAARIWEPFESERLEGRTLGVVGYGDIGRAVASRARALGMRVLALRRSPAGAEDGVLAELVARSDDVVVATPLTPETQAIVGRREIAALRPHAVLVNVGRGPCVDEAALVEALSGRRIRGAALDVFEREPLAPDHPLWALDNVLVSPHCGDRARDWLERATACFLDNLERLQLGAPLSNVVDKRRGY
jgi:phosphoglycerate dehydrogenase-like enzyme